MTVLGKSLPLQFKAMKIKQEIINIREFNELLIKKGLEMMKKNVEKGNNRQETPLNAREKHLKAQRERYYSNKLKARREANKAQ